MYKTFESIFYSNGKTLFILSVEQKHAPLKIKFKLCSLYPRFNFFCVLVCKNY